jgi:ferredoxin
MCNFHAPDVYPLDDDGYNALDGEYDVEPGLEDAARRGALNCPERAIEVIEE